MTTTPPSLPDETAWKHEDLVVGGVRLHVVRAGEGPPVVMLHGFPDFWFTWRHQIGALAGAGFAVLAPDMRGYNTSEKPHGVASYDIDNLVADVVELVDRHCGGRAVLVGHDWGGIVAWSAVLRHPERFDKLIVLNAPHPEAFQRDFWSTDQWRRSWYMFLFQIPFLPEALIGAFGLRVIEEMLRREILRPGAVARGEIDRYKEAFAKPGALTSAIHYYRAALRRTLFKASRARNPIDVPTLLLWGERDPHLQPSLTTGLEPWVKNLTVRTFADAGHWVHIDEPEAVSRAMVEFLAPAAAASASTPAFVAPGPAPGPAPSPAPSPAPTLERASEPTTAAE